MSNVTLTIGGRGFTLACADGEEAHALRLGALIDEKVRLAGVAGQSEVRMLLYAAVLLADEVHELGGGGSRAAVEAEGLGPKLEHVAQRIENLAAILEAGLERAASTP